MRVCTRQLIDAAMDETGVKPKVAVEMNSVEGLVSLVSADGPPTILPALAVKSRDVHVVRLTDPRPTTFVRATARPAMRRPSRSSFRGDLWRAGRRVGRLAVAAAATARTSAARPHPCGTCSPPVPTTVSITGPTAARSPSAPWPGPSPRARVEAMSQPEVDVAVIVGAGPFVASSRAEAVANVDLCAARFEELVACWSDALLAETWTTTAASSGPTRASWTPRCP